MKLTFIEAPAFSRWREHYLDDESFTDLQTLLLENPTAGNVIPGTFGFRKLRLSDSRRRKGKRGGLRIIYYLLPDDAQIWLFTLYDKDEASDLSDHEKHALRRALALELAARGRRS